MATVAPSAAPLPHQAPPPRGARPRLQPPGSAPMRALQILRETQPLPTRRQSVPTTFPPPRGPPPLQSLFSKSGTSAAQSQLGKLMPNANPSLVGKPPPPSTHHPIAVLDPLGGRRRHSTGNAPGAPPGAPMRPPPPRGPRPPLASGETTRTAAIAAIDSSGATASNPLQAARLDAARRRSSGFRAPPPGPPPPGRGQSGMLTLPPRPVEGPSGRPTQPVQHHEDGKQPQVQAGSTAATDAVGAATAAGAASVASARTTAASASGQVVLDGSVQGFDAAASALRRVSFSTYGGPPPTKEKREVGDIAGTVGGVAGGAVGTIQPGSSETLPIGSQSLPQLQRRRRSSEKMSGPGRPAPPRPLGNPPPPSADGVRRYSISNEITNNEINLSRRMSKVVDAPPPGGEGAPQPSDPGADAVEENDDTAGRGAIKNAPPVASSNNNNNNSSSNSGERQTQPSNQKQQSSPSPEGRAAVLWYNMGVTKQKDGDVTGAVECYERAAKDGHAKARHNLAAVFEKGFAGVPKNDAEAVRLFRLAAEQGLAESSYSLAMHLKFGLGTEQDDAQCVYYLEQASEQGLAKAMFNLGLMYEKRRGVSQEAPEADLLEATRECYGAAAEAGVTKAMVNLGVLYLSGRLPGHEQGEALGCFKKAADEGDLSGLWNLALCYERGVGVARDPLAAQALQRQCRDREKAAGAGQQQPKRGAPPQSAGVVADRPHPIPGGGESPAPPFPRRRSSDPSTSVAPRSPGGAENNGGGGNDDGDDSNCGDKPKSSTTNNGSGGGSGNNKGDRSSERRRSSRRRSSSPSPPSASAVPVATPPPPKGAPPNAVVAGSPEADTAQERASAAASRRRSSSSKKTPNEYVPRADRPLQTAEAPAADPPSASSPPWIPPPPRERKNSLMLRPTPQAIARVKAAVERRKKLQAAAMASSAAAAAAVANAGGNGSDREIA